MTESTASVRVVGEAKLHDSAPILAERFLDVVVLRQWVAQREQTLVFAIPDIPALCQLLASVAAKGEG